MMEFPVPAAEHSLKSLGSLMQRLPLEAEAVKQQRRVTEPTGAPASVWAEVCG